jgi:hypothetical protein
LANIKRNTKTSTAPFNKTPNIPNSYLLDFTTNIIPSSDKDFAHGGCWIWYLYEKESVLCIIPNSKSRALKF